MFPALAYPHERHLIAQGGYHWVRDARSTAAFLVFALADLGVLAFLLVGMPALGVEIDAGGEHAVAFWAIVVLCPLWVIVFVLLAVYRGRGLARDATGTRMRRRHAVAYAAAGQAVVDDILGRFASGDPANYAPMPAGIGRNGTLRVQIWTADADRLGFVAISSGMRQSQLVVLDDLAYDRLAAVLDRGISRPGAAAATPAG